MSDVESAQDYKAEPIDWLWEETIPKGMITLIGGRPDSGKSLFSMWLASQLAKKRQHILVSNREDPIPQVIIPRLNALNANLKYIHFWHPYLPRDMKELEDKIRTLKIKCVILDPASAHMSASIYNDQDVRTCLGPLSEICWRTGCSVIMIHHTIKSVTEGAAIRAFGGSGGGLTGVARAAFIFGQSPDDEDERVLASAKFNLGPKPNSIIFEMDEYEWLIEKANGKVKMINAGKLLYKNNNSKISAEKVLLTSAGLQTVKTPDKKAEAAEWLTNYLAYGARKQQEVAEDSNHYAITFRTLRRAAEDIGIEKDRRGFGKDGYWIWRLPKGHPSLIPTCCDKPEIVTEDNLQQKCIACGTAFGLASPGDGADAT